jgi:hypothetical protein
MEIEVEEAYLSGGKNRGLGQEDVVHRVDSRVNGLD